MFLCVDIRSNSTTRRRVALARMFKEAGLRSPHTQLTKVQREISVRGWRTGASSKQPSDISVRLEMRQFRPITNLSCRFDGPMNLADIENSIPNTPYGRLFLTGVCRNHKESYILDQWGTMLTSSWHWQLLCFRFGSDLPYKWFVRLSRRLSIQTTKWQTHNVVDLPIQKLEKPRAPVQRYTKITSANYVLKFRVVIG